MTAVLRIVCGIVGSFSAGAALGSHATGSPVLVVAVVALWLYAAFTPPFREHR